jgi:O-glycosyl hydrolase
MPWRYWQPEKNKDPLAAARSGRLDPHVQQAMEMAKKLQQKGIPIILTAWSAPDWAVIGKPKFSHQKNEPWGNPLNPDSLQYTYKSITAYIQYLQEHYGAQIRFFSFNESDLGIYIRQTGIQHDELIKGLGKYFLQHGLKTKILLGDNSDATTYSFIDPALHDTAAYPYIGAVSFHSWRGWETETLSRWAAAARKINLSLIIAEGSIDAAAWAYPEIFLEQCYAMEEINLYIRLLAICQPLSILQWQLTADYSPLSGGNIFGKAGPLEPTQRFWNLKQLASTPAGLNYLPVSFAAANISCAALGNKKTGIYVFHITNNGAERKVDLRGIPASVKSFKIISTGSSLSMRQGSPVTVDKGRVQFTLPAGCYTTLTSN